MYNHGYLVCAYAHKLLKWYHHCTYMAWHCGLCCACSCSTQDHECPVTVKTYYLCMFICLNGQAIIIPLSFFNEICNTSGGQRWGQVWRQHAFTAIRDYAVTQLYDIYITTWITRMSLCMDEKSSEQVYRMWFPTLLSNIVATDVRSITANWCSSCCALLHPNFH